MPWKRLRQGAAGLLAVLLVLVLIPWSKFRQPCTAEIDADYVNVVERMERYVKWQRVIEIRRGRDWARYEFWSQVNWWHGIRVIVDLREQRKDITRPSPVAVEVRTFADHGFTPGYSVFGERHPDTVRKIIAHLKGNGRAIRREAPASD